MTELIYGEWYWVSIDGEEWFPAKRDSMAIGCWTTRGMSNAHI